MVDLEKKVRELADRVENLEKQNKKLEQKNERLERKLLGKVEKDDGEDGSDEMSRRSFLKKAGIGAAGLAALASPVSALDIKDQKFDVYTQDSGSVKSLGVDGNGDVEIPNGNLNIGEDIDMGRGEISSLGKIASSTVEPLIIEGLHDSGFNTTQEVRVQASESDGESSIVLGANRNYEAVNLEIPLNFSNKDKEIQVEGNTAIRLNSREDVEIPNGDLDIKGNEIILPTDSSRGIIQGGEQVSMEFRENGRVVMLDNELSQVQFFNYIPNDEVLIGSNDIPVRFRTDLEISDGQLDIKGNNIEGNQLRISPESGFPGPVIRNLEAGGQITLMSEDSTEIIEAKDNGNVGIPNGGLDFDNSVSLAGDGGDLVVRDGEVELIRQPEGSPTEFLQGVDTGPIEAPEDTFSQIINTPVTDEMDAGETVGHTFSINSQTAVAIRAEADGNGGVQNLEYEFFNSDGEKGMEIEENGDIKAKGQFQDESL